MATLMAPERCVLVRSRVERMMALRGIKEFKVLATKMGLPETEARKISRWLNHTNDIKMN